MSDNKGLKRGRSTILSKNGRMKTVREGVEQKNKTREGIVERKHAKRKTKVIRKTIKDKNKGKE